MNYENKCPQKVKIVKSLALAIWEEKAAKPLVEDIGWGEIMNKDKIEMDGF